MCKWNRVPLIAFILFVFVAVSGVARAQRLDGSLRVSVTDTSDSAVEDATVTVTNEATNTSVTATASSNGTYVFPNLLVGSYTVTVEKGGGTKSTAALAPGLGGRMKFAGMM